jgi:hypothetical protein
MAAKANLHLTVTLAAHDVDRCVLIVANHQVTVLTKKKTFPKFYRLKMFAVGKFARLAFPTVNPDRVLPAFKGNPFQNIHEDGKYEVGYFADLKNLHALDVQIFNTPVILMMTLRTP